MGSHLPRLARKRTNPDGKILWNDNAGRSVIPWKLFSRFTVKTQERDPDFVFDAGIREVFVIPFTYPNLYPQPIVQKQFSISIHCNRDSRRFSIRRDETIVLRTLQIFYRVFPL